MKQTSPVDSKGTAQPLAAGQAAKMTLILAHASNGDIAGGYWSPYTSPKRQVVEVESLEDAVLKKMAWISQNGFGGGNMARDCGTVMQGGKAIARISYNGRAWQPGAYPTAEIPLALSV